MEVNLSLGQHCKPIVSSQTGYALVGKEYKSFPTKDYPACMMTCHNDEKCMSVNFHLVTKTCDLNTQTKESKPACYKGRQNSIYSTNMAFRTPGPEPLKGSKELPVKSCLDIRVSGDSRGTGVYWIDPTNTGNPIQAYCDMTTDGGGWTIVNKLVQPNTTRLPYLLMNTYEVIKEYNRSDKNVIPTGAALLDIHQKMGFHQIHFYCRKVSVGRVVSIMTKNNTAGQAVVSYFTTLGRATVVPTACGSFDRLPEDTSYLALNCSRWGGDEFTGSPADTNQWGGVCCPGPARIAARPFQIVSSPTYGFEFQVYYLCDNDVPQHSNSAVLPDANDTWQISVR